MLLAAFSARIPYLVTQPMVLQRLVSATLIRMETRGEMLAQGYVTRPAGVLLELSVQVALRHVEVHRSGASKHPLPDNIVPLRSHISKLRPVGKAASIPARGRMLRRPEPSAVISQSDALNREQHDLGVVGDKASPSHC